MGTIPDCEPFPFARQRDGLIPPGCWQRNGGKGIQGNHSLAPIPLPSFRECALLTLRPAYNPLAKSTPLANSVLPELQFV